MLVSLRTLFKTDDGSTDKKLMVIRSWYPNFSSTKTADGYSFKFSYSDGLGSGHYCKNKKDIVPKAYDFLYSYVAKICAELENEKN